MRTKNTGFFILAFMLGIAVFGGGEALAQQAKGGVLFVEPYRLVLGPDEVNSTISVSNKSDKPHRYNLILIDQVMNEGGTLERRDTFDYSVRDMIKFAPKHFLIQPGDVQTVRVAVTRPAGLADGDYHSHLLFQEVPVGTTDRQLETKTVTDQNNLYAIAMPVIIQQGRATGAIAIGDARFSKGADGRQGQLNIDFLRTGNAEAAVKLSADYVPEGKSPITVLEPQWIRIYREVGKVSRSFALVNIPENAQGGKIIIYMDESDERKTAKKEIALN